MSIELLALLFGFWCFGGWSSLVMREILDERRERRPARVFRISGPPIPPREPRPSAKVPGD